MRLKKYFCLAVISLFLLIGLLVFLSLNSPKFSTKTSSYSDVFNKVRMAEKQNGNVELYNEELNALINFLIKNKLKHGSIEIKGIYSDIKGNTIALFVPLSYKNIKLVASTEGQILYENNKFIYKPKSIKIGKLLLPNLILFNIENYQNELGLSISKGQIEFNSNVFPFQIKSLEIKNNLFLVGIEAMQGEKVKSNIGVSESNDLESLKNIVSESDNIKSKKVTTPNNSVEFQDTSKANNNTTNQSNTINSNDKGKKLSILYDQLIITSKTLKSTQEVQVICMIENVIKNLMNDPSYNYTRDVSQIKQYYGKLTNVQKGDLKQSIVSNVDLQNAIDLQKMLQ